jgi:hypothetical protein
MMENMDHSGPAFEHWPNISGLDPGDLFIALISVAFSNDQDCVPLDIDRLWM